VDAPERYPAKDKVAPPPSATASAAVLRDEGRILLARRPLSGLLAGLWELPGGMGDDLGGSLRERLGLTMVDAVLLGEVTHVFSHLRLVTRVFSARAEGTPVATDYLDVRWVPVAEVDGMALSTLARKTLRLAGSAPPGRSSQRSAVSDQRVRKQPPASGASG
jgi:adenine-specific DNA glycosylase